MPLLLFLVIRKRPPIQQNIIGLGFIVLSAAAALVIFLAAGIYVKPAAPVLATAVTFIAYVVMRFMGEAQEKNFLRRAFGVYIADEVIDEIVEDPAKLKLGGENRLMTAMFTDIRGFSTISEQLSAEQLVQLLNQYLSGMSDIILDEKGVVDKYEGDAIIAFWGAPVMQQGHAEHALASALKMKKLESELNKRFLAEKMSPGPLLTRIGINTGDMVAGNMGTQRKMNYTIMGNSVNLAARLEGVNKLYGTWILTTDFTAEGNMDRFVFRKLDRVRVIGIHTPVQLRELVAERNDMAPEQLDFLEQFSQSLDTFERREWKKAEQQFAALSERNPADGPSQLYLNRSRDYLKKPPADSWDGVFNMTQK
jgi:adenylate cyclase